MLDFGRLERDVARRSRILRGVQGAGIAFVTSVAAVLVASMAARLGLLSPRPDSAVAALLFIAAAVIAGFVVGYASRPDIARLLLSIDLALATGERLCSLHELHSRRDGAPFENRIVEKLAEVPPAWRCALRLRRTDILPWLAGAGALALAVFLFLTAVPPAPAATADSRSQVRVSNSRGATPRSSVPSGAEPDPVAASEHGLSRSEPGSPLIDTLVELPPAPASGVLLGDLGDEAPAEAEPPARDSRQSLSEYLTQLLGRAEADLSQTFALTEPEKNALQSLLQDMPGSSLRRSLSSLLGDETGDALKARLEESQRLLEGSSRGEEGEASTQAGRSPRSPNAEADESHPESIGWVLLPPSSDGEAEATEADGRQTGADAGKSETQEGSAPPRNEEGGSAIGAQGAEEAPAPPPGVGFVPEELLGSVGSEGDLRRYLTKGIPFEPPPVDRGPIAALSLNYETLRALLEARALAPEVQAIVRAYFVEITQEGP
ncbi:MAG: hypothetical protein ABFD77_04505 [Thermotogota bacterium]